MAPIQKLNSRVRAIQNIRGMMGLDMLQLAAQHVEGIELQGDEIIDTQRVDVPETEPESLLDEIANGSNMYVADIELQVDEIIDTQRVDVLEPEPESLLDEIANRSNLYVTDIELQVDEIIDTQRVDVPEPVPENLNVVADYARRLPKDLSYEQVSPYFTTPMAVASRELRCNRSTLQVWCRMPRIPRWPYRKINSINILLWNVEVVSVVL